MSGEPNYYQPPQASLDATLDGHHAYFEGDKLVVLQGRSIPTERCVKCGDLASKVLHKKFGWHPPWVLVTLLAGLLIYVIVALCLTKRGQLSMGMCPQCAGRRRNSILFGWLASIGTFAAMIFAFFQEWFGIGLLLLLAWLTVSVVAALMARTIVPIYIDNYLMRFKGASPRVLEADGNQYI